MAQNTSASADGNEGAAFSFPVDDAKKALWETGAYVQEDAAVGRRVDEFINTRRLPLRQVEGLAFCAQNSFYDKGIRDVIESSLDGPHWGLAKLYNGGILPSDKAHFFVKGPTRRTVFIMLFTPNTRVVLFEGSHNREIPSKVMSDFGLLTLPHDKLEVEGVTRVEHHMAQGGFALIDGRVGWTILEGQQLMIGYASQQEIAYWGDLVLGDTPPMRAKIAEMRANGIKAKFKLVPPPSTSSNA